jgi:hypothetical protein
MEEHGMKTTVAMPETAVHARAQSGARRRSPTRRPRIHGRMLMADLLADHYYDVHHLGALRETFAREGYVRLPGLLRPDVLAILQGEMRYLKERAVERHFVMEEFRTPRHMSVLGGSRITVLSPTFASLYSCYDVRFLVGAVAGRAIHSCRHPEEFMVANFLVGRGDTHGWHLDDPPYALVLFLEAPDEAGGGLLEFIPGWKAWQDGADAQDLPLDRLVALARARGLVRTAHHAAGEAYLLKADECLHRVTELDAGATSRSVVNLAFESDQPITYHRTASILYGPGSPD